MKRCGLPTIAATSLPESVGFLAPNGFQLTARCVGTESTRPSQSTLPLLPYRLEKTGRED